MPRINFAEILSFTSEDPNHPADNLLSGQSFRKWKIAATELGVPASVTIKLDHLTTIRSVDVGNEGCAFVEVFVAREDDKFEVLLATSSFMSPLESRNLSDLNRVRMFGADKLTRATAEQKWSRVKIVCTQPFNKQIQFGIAFITLNAPDATPTQTGEVKVGGLVLRSEDEEEEGGQLVAGALFAKLRAKAAAAATDTGSTESLKRKTPDDVGFYQLKKKQNTTQDSSVSSPSTSKDKSTDRPKKNLEAPKTPRLGASGDKDDCKKVKNEKDMKKLSDKKRDDSNKEKNKATPVASNSKPGTNPTSVAGGSSSNRRTLDITSKNRHAAAPIDRKYAPFSSLLGSVVYVMSGYQNPKRSNLRDKMTAMGATYKADWDPTCTHLICAFTNTPKYKAIKGKGRIVNHHWIEDCHTFKKKMKPKKYQLEEDSDSDESEEEIWAEELRPKLPAAALTRDCDALSAKEGTPHDNQGPAVANNEDHNSGNTTEEVDTDDEIQRVLERNSKKENNKNKGNKPVANGNKPPVDDSDDIYDDDTDEDDVITDKHVRGLPPLPSPFTGLVFFLYGSPKHEKELRRYIHAYDGHISEYMDNSVKLVITEKPWDNAFDEALKSQPLLQFVRPAWVWLCSESETKMPLQPHILHKT